MRRWFDRTALLDDALDFLEAVTGGRANNPIDRVSSTAIALGDFHYNASTWGGITRGLVDVALAVSDINEYSVALDATETAAETTIRISKPLADQERDAYHRAKTALAEASESLGDGIGERAPALLEEIETTLDDLAGDFLLGSGSIHSPDVQGVYFGFPPPPNAAPVPDPPRPPTPPSYISFWTPPGDTPALYPPGAAGDGAAGPKPTADPQPAPAPRPSADDTLNAQEQAVWLTTTAGQLWYYRNVLGMSLAEALQLAGAVTYDNASAQAAGLPTPDQLQVLSHLEPQPVSPPPPDETALPSDVWIGNPGIPAAV